MKGKECSTRKGGPPASVKPVFVRAQGCDGKFSSAAFSALGKEFRTSAKYRLVLGVDDEGRRDTVLIMYMNCVERNDALGGWPGLCPHYH